MSKKLNRKVVAMVMATSLAATTVPAQVIQKSNQVDSNIKGLEQPEVTTGSAIEIEQTTGSTIQIIPVEEVAGNKIKNFSFEETTNSPVGQWESSEGALDWKASPWGGNYSMPKVSIDSEEKISGNYSVKLQAGDGNARGWVEQSIEVKPNTTYILEGYMKAENVSGTRFGIQVLEYVGNATKPIETNIDQTLKMRINKDTQDWTYYKVEFKTSEQTTRIDLRGYLGTHSTVVAGATAWVDDLVLTEKPVVAVEGVMLPEKVRVAEGDTVTLKPTFTPADATNQKVTWEIEDETVATVSASGMVKGISAGTTTVKVITEDGHHEATCEITVEKGGAVNLLENGSFEESIQVSNTTEKRIWKDGKAPKGWNNLWVPTEGSGLQLSLDQTEVSHGAQSVHINAPKQSRVCYMTLMNIDPSQAYRLSMNIKTQDVVGTGVYFRVQYLDKDNKKTQDALPSISGIKGTKDWDNYELVLKDIPEDTVTLKIEVFFENATGQAWIDDARLVETYDFSLSQSTAKLLAGETLQLEAVFGADVPNKNVEWISSNEAVAMVDTNGLVTTLVPGAATITATTIDGNKATCSISVEDPTLISIYKELRQNWSDRMTINDLADKSNPDYVENMASLAVDVQELWDTMNKYDSQSGLPDTRQELWSKYTSDKVSADLTSIMANLRTMARAYASEGCSLYQNEELAKDILAALDWFYENRYNEEVKMYNNWWDWDIGVPQKLNDVLVLMYDQLSSEQLDQHLRAINRFVPTPVSVPGGPNPLTGANLLDTAMVSAVSGMLEESNRRISEARDAVSEVLPYVTKGDGFYEDGSFIQHTDFPYAGGYGGVLMSGIANLLFITEGTPWEVTDPLIENVYDWIINAFEPVYYKGAIMDMVSGRGISRYNSSHHNKGKGLLPKMLALAETAPEPKKMQIKSFVKENVMADSVCEEGYFDRMNINDVLAIKELLADDSIPARGDLALHKVYGSMDRTVHHRPGFSLGISMHSTRIAAYEVGNGENKKAWHTADGMLYLYNDDVYQYGDDFWPTINPMRMPGTTTDHSERTNKDWAHNTSSKAWVGGSSINDLYGATGMEFEMEPGKSTLTGKKSWFMFDDEIVALGAGINASDNQAVETIVENRKIKDSGDNTFIVDGQNVLDNFGQAEVTEANWAFLGGNTAAGTDTIGYYFPGGVDIQTIREARTGTWNAINDGGPTTPITKNYLSIAIEHGNNPVDADYSYVLLPNKTQEEVANYSEQADITILENTKGVQAVRENKLGVVGMNFWNPGTVEYVTAHNPSSIMIEEGLGELSLGISDPTHLAKEVKVVLDKIDYKVVSKDDTVSVKNLGDQIEIIVNTDKSMGKTHKVKLVSNNPVELSLDKTNVSLRKGNSETVKVSVVPEVAGIEGLVWHSSDETVASIIDHQDGTATINGLRKGEATITVTTADGKLEASCKVTVKNNDSGQGNQNPDNQNQTKPKDKEKILVEKVNTLSTEQKGMFKTILVNEIPYTTLKSDVQLHSSQLPKEVVEMLNANPQLLVEMGIDLTEYIKIITLEPIQNVMFKDVKTSHWAYDSIKQVAELGIVKGYPQGTFKPNGVLGLEDAFTFLDRVLLLNQQTEMKISREVVEKYVTNEGHWAFNHVASIASRLTEETLKEVMADPSQPITREVLAQVIYEISGAKKVEKVESKFKDLEKSKYQDALLYCVEEGILQGINETQLAPQKVLTRAELMTILIRLNNQFK